jgi:hypothetical protein
LTRGREPFDDAQTTDVVAPAQVVRSWCRRGTEPDGVRLQPEADTFQSASGGDRFRPFTGESTKQAGSPLRAERRMRPVLSWRLTRGAFTLHTRLRTHRASGVPRALSSRGRDVPRKARAQLRRETAKPRPNHCRCLTFEYERNRNRSLRSLCTSSPHHERRPREGGDP